MKFTIPNEKQKIMRSEKILIAEFMGLISIQRVEGFYTTRVGNLGVNQGGFLEDMKYDSSWDWLMPVVEKIKNIKANEHPDFTSVNWRRQVIDMPISSDLTSVYNKVVKFIKWYRSQPEGNTVNQQKH